MGGASCTNSKTASVQDPISLTKVAKEHLKQIADNISSNNISRLLDQVYSKLRFIPANSDYHFVLGNDKLQKLIKKDTESRDGDVEDLDKEL